jgi:hypothetical protein
MQIRKLGDNKPKILIIQGSPRDKDTCPNMSSKSHDIVDYIKDKWLPFIDFHTIDLAVNQSKQPIIQTFHVNKGVDYYTANKTFDKQKEFKERADVLIENLLNYLDEKN